MEDGVRWCNKAWPKPSLRNTEVTFITVEIISPIPITLVLGEQEPVDPQFSPDSPFATRRGWNHISDPPPRLASTALPGTSLFWTSLAGVSDLGCSHLLCEPNGSLLFHMRPNKAKLSPPLCHLWGLWVCALSTRGQECEGTMFGFGRLALVHPSLVAILPPEHRLWVWPGGSFYAQENRTYWSLTGMGSLGKNEKLLAQMCLSTNV